MEQNFDMFERLRGKKRSLINQTIQKLMKRFAGANQLVVDEIVEMVIDDLELNASPEELVLKCQLIRALYNVVDALAKRFGEVHVE